MMASTHLTLTICLLTVATTAVCQDQPPSKMTIPEIFRYFPNITASYRQFACSEQEFECFKENKLLHEADGKCYAAGQRGPCADGQIFHADKAEFSRRGGHLRGTCENACPEVDHAPVAATGECMSRSDVQDKICNSDLYLRPAMNMDGEWVCVWTTLICNLTQPYASGGYPGEYSTYMGICSLPAFFSTLIDGGENATVPAEKPADHPLLEYFSNNTLPDREFPCSEEEKQCLQWGRLLKDGICYSVKDWSWRCDAGDSFHLDWDEAMKKDGKLAGTCNSPCKDFKYPQVKTGLCVDHNEFSNEICRYEWGMTSQVDMFGRMACECLWTPDTPAPPPPSLPPPASSPGHCRAPDFSNPVQGNMHYDMTLSLGFKLPCSEEEFACLQKGLVLFDGGCHALRTRGPCAENEQLVLDKEALAHAQLKSKCATSPCPAGSVLISIDGTCLTHQQVTSRLCPEQSVSLDEFGGWLCDHQPDNRPGNLSSVTRQEGDGSCELPSKYGEPTPLPSHPLASAGGRPGVVGYDGTSGYSPENLR